MIDKHYTGIGSRNAPVWALDQAKMLGKKLAECGYILRSGAAEGMDAAFEEGCDLSYGKKQIFLPWKNFNEHPSPFYQLEPLAFEMAKEVHPAWDRLSDGAKKLHARNIYQVLGLNLDHPSRFILCYTPWDKGGTLQAIHLANELDVPVYNFLDLYDLNFGSGDIYDIILKKTLIFKYRLKSKNDVIHQFKDKYNFLSNFFYSTFTINGLQYKTVEHYFQSQKTNDIKKQNVIRSMNYPASAKKMGRKTVLRDDWEEIKDDIMYEGVFAKFAQNKDLRKELLDTEDAYLEEGNWWHDNKWGNCTCKKCISIKGENKLGHILMKVRKELQNEPFYCKLFNNYRYDDKCTEMACEFCESFYDEKRKKWWYHPESESYVYDTIENIKEYNEPLEDVDNKIQTRVVNLKNHEFDIYIGRGSKWGNPFRIGIHGNKKEVIAKYREYLYNNKKLMKCLPQLKNKRLGCYCSPDDCHGDVIAELIENL